MSREEKQAALRGALSYRPIADSELLGRFLQFVGQKAIDGDGQHLKEYVIATAVFHRPASFDPRRDPIVRVQARRLRDKLEEYYRGPGAADPIHVVVPKGTYLPQFVPRQRQVPIPASLWMWISLALATVLVLQLWLAHTRRSGQDGPDGTPQSASSNPLLRPFLDSPQRTVITFSSDVFLKDDDGNMFRLRDQEKLDPHGRLLVDPRDLLVSPSLPAVGPLYVDMDYSGTGEAVCLFLLTRYFTQRARLVEVRASTLINPQELRGANVIFLGSPRENIILSKIITPLDFQFVRRMNPSGRPFLAIENQRPLAGEQAWYEAHLHPVTRSPEEVYGLISYSPGLAAGTYFLNLAGQSTAATQAACEYLVDAGALQRLPKASFEPLPPMYQILIKTKVRDFVPTHIEYVTHHTAGRTQPE